MKKVLLATTVLAMSATVAAAEVTVGGNGRMGVTYNDALTNELAFTSRIRITFSASGETDGGLSFGGSIRADNSAGGAAGTAGSVYLSGAFGKITMGDVAGAAEMAVGDLDGVGLTGVGDHNENIYLSNARRSAVRYEYSTGGLTFAVSADNPGTDGDEVEYSFYGGAIGPDAPAWGIFVPAVPTESTYSVGVNYAMDNYSFGAGYETATVAGASADHWIIGASATFSNITLKATYGQADWLGLKLDQAGVSATYSQDALSVTGYYRQESINVIAEDFTAVGIGASYDLGGGASLVGGISRTKIDNVPESGNTKADFGISFSF